MYAMYGNALPPRGQSIAMTSLSYIAEGDVKMLVGGNRLPLSFAKAKPSFAKAKPLEAMHCPFLHRLLYITEGYVCDVWQSIKNKVFDALPP